ncbi:DUF2783 domain-containing protein [Salipiger marinus]|uniref:DUF2783 domain-containing protein n=1 Tax=Salipiger marinus TaxID=555512 RepID=UPI001E53D148|nr:DUF2783 domain-containing protein [Salipiger manganoxidans]MCD1618753.1 DUF2783 domain-containing protein [Salipiger manganoxidans]MEB3417807.1 DUF2783 domain-containing protein [Salipiger manganoxidans]
MSAQQMGLGARGDEFYEALMAAHDGLSEAESHALNARLVLLLANRIGDVDALKDLLAVARSCG